MNISIKTERISEIQANILSLTASQTGAASRLTYYTDMLNNGLSGYEQTSTDATAAALAANIWAALARRRRPSPMPCRKSARRLP